MTYKEELTSAMTWLGQKDGVLFLGQGVTYPGNALFNTLLGVPREKLIELPVAEEMQMGMSIGLALTGKTVISIYPRFDFLLLAVNQLVNHLDKLEEFTHGEYKAKVIIRVGVGSKSPMYPGVQHCGDYTEQFKYLLDNIQVLRINYSGQAESKYEAAYNADTSTLIVEDMELYGMD